MPIHIWHVYNRNLISATNTLTQFSKRNFLCGCQFGCGCSFWIVFIFHLKWSKLGWFNWLKSPFSGEKKTLFWKMWTLIGSLFGQIVNLRCFRIQSNHSLLPREVPWHRRFWRCASIRRLVKWNRQKRNLFTKKHSISQNKQKLHKFFPPVSSEAK